MSFLQTLAITRKNRTPMKIPEGVYHPFSYLLSPLNNGDSLKPRSRSKQKTDRTSLSMSRYMSRELQLNVTSQCFRPKKHYSVKACTIDFEGINFQGQPLQFRRKSSSSMKVRNSKSLRNKKTKAQRYSVQAQAKYSSLNGSLEMRVSSLGVRVQANNPNSEGSKWLRMGSSQMNRDKQIRYVNSQASKLRDKQRAKNIKSMMVQQIKPWDTIALNQQDQFR